MASLLHRGMIHPMSIIWRPVSEFEIGDGAIFHDHDEHFEVVKVVEILHPYRLSPDVRQLRFDNGYGVEGGADKMVRVPPINPRGYYND